MYFCSILFYVRGVSYEHICGQAKAYQKGQTDAFNAQRNAIKPSIDSAYVDGINLFIDSYCIIQTQQLGAGFGLGNSLSS